MNISIANRIEPKIKRFRHLKQGSKKQCFRFRQTTRDRDTERVRLKKKRNTEIKITADRYMYRCFRLIEARIQRKRQIKG